MLDPEPALGPNARAQRVRPPPNAVRLVGVDGDTDPVERRGVRVEQRDGVARRRRAGRAEHDAVQNRLGGEREGEGDRQRGEQERTGHRGEKGAYP